MRRRIWRVTRRVFCVEPRDWREIKNNMAALVNSLTSLLFGWNSFFNAFWISWKIFTSEDFFSAKRSSTVAHPTVWSLPLHCGLNIISRRCPCLSQSKSTLFSLSFFFFFRGSSCFTGRHFEIGIPRNPAKIKKPVPLMWKLRQKPSTFPSRYKSRDGSSVPDDLSVC